MFDFFKNRWVLITVLLIFALFKIPNLLLPFYWDESSPYVPAVRQMYHNGLSLLPNALDANLSRGHPLFLHFFFALWITIFGNSNFALHACALFISLLFLITIYETGLRLFNQRVAVLALLLIATYVPFFVQSSFVLPEVLVAFLAFLSIGLYVKEKYLLSTLTLTALFFTKESGMIVGFVMGTDALIALFNSKTEIRKRLIRLLPVTIAGFFIGLFFIIQKLLRGWYVFPFHTDSVLLKWDAIWDRFGTGVIHADFCMNSEYILFLALLVYSVIFLVKNKSIKNITPLSLAVLIVIAWFMETSRIIRLDGKGSIYYIGTYLIFFTFIILYLRLLFFFAKKEFLASHVERRFVILIGLFILCLSLFSSVLVFIPRYVLANGIAALFLLAVFFDILISHTSDKLYYPLIIVIMATAYLSFRGSNSWGDEEMGFTKGVKTQVAEVEFMEKNNFYDKHIYVNSYMGYTHLRDRDCGFLSSKKNFKYTGFDLMPNTDVVIWDNVENFNASPGFLANNPDFILIKKISYDDKWAEIYCRKQK